MSHGAQIVMVSGWGIGEIVLMVLHPLDAEDLNRDGRIDVSDVIDLISRWGDPGGPADLDGNGSVDVMDLQLLLSAW